MKKKEFVKEVAGLALPELREKGKSLAEELMKLRFRRSTGQLEQGHRIREVRRNLARVLTQVKRKELQATAK